MIIFSLPFFISASTSVFIENKGQLVNREGLSLKDVLCIYKGANYDVYFQNNRISYVLKSIKKNQKQQDTPFAKKVPSYVSMQYRVDLEFLFSQSQEITFNSPIEINQKYLNEKIGEIFIKDGYQEILYKNIYNGIDIRFYIKNQSLKYDFIIHPNGNYKDIKMKYNGAENLINKSSKIIITTPLGNLEENIPEIYQQSSSGKTNIKGNYIINENIISFQIDNYNPNKNLIIDPWATFLGGMDIEESYSTSIDKQGNTYISGYTGSSNFPVVVGAIQTIKKGLYDAFLTKLDTTGNILWSTFYGGLGDEYGYKVIVDSDDNPYLIGYTNGNDLLISSSGVHQSISNGSYDSFILKMDSDGDFIWSTYYGGSGADFTLSADIDNNNNIVIAGYTSSTDLPLINPYQNDIAGALDAFLAKFDSTGNLVWSTYAGGANTEDVHALKIDNLNNIIITGETYSSDFPTSIGAYQSNNNGNLDVFLAKYDSLGNRIFSTYFGGTSSEDAHGITTDILNNIYLVGYSSSNDFPILGNNIYQNIKNFGRDGFIAKFTPSGQPLRSTFIGGSGDEYFTSVKISSTNALYVTGYSNSLDIPIIGAAYQINNKGLTDGIYYKLDTALTPNYSTYIGGISADYIYDLKIDSNQLLTFAGYTSSPDFPVTPNVFQDTISGQSDAFIFQSDSIFNVVTNIPNSFIPEVSVKISPNPFYDHFNIIINNYNKSNSYQLVIYNIEGKKVFSKAILKKDGLIYLDKNLIAGNYFLVILKELKLITSLIIIKQ
ncbi:MAG: SBBP repeat-containing protein [Flavobacteriales bacterium]|nr:SBBP repeat-containing protein [Flavobacteriales bacterium]